MLTDLQSRLKRAGRWLPVALLPLLPFAAQAQALNYTPTNAVNTTSTFTDLGTTGTVISTTSTDDANSTAQPIGFTFNYNGTAFTQFVLNTNGLIRLGAAAPSVANLFFTQDFSTTQTAVDPISSTNAADVNLLMPFNTDLVAGTSAAEYRVTTTGAAGSQVCTIQWKNVSDKAGTGTDTAPTQYSNFTFQVKLYQGTNNVEFVYGPTTASTNTAISRFPTVGIKGSDATSSVLGNKTTGAAAWSTTVFVNGPYAAGGSTHNYRNVAPPDLGRTYRFLPGAAVAPTNDECATATALTPASTCTVTTTTNTAATASAGVPAPGLNCFLAATPISNDVWFTAVVPASGNLTVTTSAITGSQVNDTGLVIYTGSCGNLTEVGCSDDTSTSNFFSSAALTGLTPGATVYIRVWSFGTTPTGQFGICATSPAPAPATDAAVTVIYTLGKVSSVFGSPVTAQAVITNAGTSALTNLPVTLTVSGATTYTNTQTVASLAVGASTTVTFTYPVAVATGTNTLTVSVPADGLATNNSQVFTQTISSNSLSYISGTTFTGGAGVAAIGSVIAVGYRTTSAAVINTVTSSFAGLATTATATYQVLIYSSGTTGQPGTVLYTSPARPRPVGVAGTIVTDAVAIPNVPVNGAFFIGIKSIAADNLSIAYQTEAPLRPGVFLFTTTGTTWTDINTSTLNSRLAVDVTFGVVTATQNAALAAAVDLYPNPAHQSFQLRVPTGLHTASAQLLNALGQVVLTRQLNLPAAGGTADFNLSSLAAGVYSLTLKSGNDFVVKRVVVE